RRRPMPYRDCRRLSRYVLTGIVISSSFVVVFGQVQQPQHIKSVSGRVVIEGGAPQRPPARPAPARRATADTLPAEISDADFSKIISDFSEPGGTYPYENFLSNEHRQQIVIPALTQATRTGEVYV